MSKVIVISDALHQQLVVAAKVHLAEATEEAIAAVWHDLGIALSAAQEGVLLPDEDVTCEWKPDKEAEEQRIRWWQEGWLACKQSGVVLPLPEEPDDGGSGMNGLRVARGEFSGFWRVIRQHTKLFIRGGSHALIGAISKSTSITIIERDWLLRGYHEWADLQPGESWPKEGTDADMSTASTDAADVSNNEAQTDMCGEEANDDNG